MEDNIIDSVEKFLNREEAGEAMHLHWDRQRRWKELQRMGMKHGDIMAQLHKEGLTFWSDQKMARWLDGKKAG